MSSPGETMGTMPVMKDSENSRRSKARRLRERRTEKLRLKTENAVFKKNMPTIRLVT